MTAIHRLGVAIVTTAAFVAGVLAPPAAATTTSFEVPGYLVSQFLAAPNGDLRLFYEPWYTTRLIEARMPAEGGMLRSVRVRDVPANSRLPVPLPDGASAFVWRGERNGRRTTSIAFRKNGVNGPAQLLTATRAPGTWPGAWATTAGELIVSYTERIGRHDVDRILRIAPGQTTLGTPITAAPGDPSDPALLVADADDGTGPAALLFEHTGRGPWTGVRRLEGTQPVGPMIKLSDVAGNDAGWGDIAADGTIVDSWMRRRRDHAGVHTEYPHLALLPPGATTPVEVPMSPLTGPARSDVAWPWHDYVIAGDRVVMVTTAGGRSKGVRLVSASLRRPGERTVTDLPTIAEYITELGIAGRPDGSVDVIALSAPEDGWFSGGTVLRIHGNPDGSWDPPEELWSNDEGNVYLDDVVERPTGGVAIGLQIDDFDLVTFTSRIILTDR